MKILLIGCGYLGTALAQVLTAQGHTVTATTRSQARQAELACLAFQVKILSGNDFEGLLTLLKGQEACILTLAADKVENYTDTYLETARALAIAAHERPELKQILYTSSTSIYGDHAGAVVDETTPPRPATSAAEILLKTEQTLLELETSERKVCILRLGEIVGPARTIADRLRRMQGIPLPGDGSSYVNYTDRDEAAKAIAFALDHKLNGIYNLCSNDHPTRKELYEDICTKEGLPQVLWDPERVSHHAGNKRVSSKKWFLQS